MRRVSRQPCDDGPLLEEQETEGQRQLHSLLLQQLHTDVDFERCVAKKKCFAPAALYKPFGQQAAGVRSLSQFQALQDGEKELASLRELGLTDTEIQVWQSRDTPEAMEKSHGVCVAPGAKQQRLQVIRDKIEARAELLARPQRFATSQPLSRREMEIEQALFQGNERLGFLSALYHREEDNHDGQQQATSSNPMDTLYRDVLSVERQQASLQDWEEEPAQVSTHRTLSDQSQTSQTENDQSEDRTENLSAPQDENRRSSDEPESSGDASERQHKQEPTRPAAPPEIKINQPIGSLDGAAKAGSVGLLTLRGKIETITDEEILQNRECEDGIRSIQRFRSYQPGKPSKVLCVKNLSAQASAAQLVALFSRFEPEDGPAVVYRLLTGRMKGQAFITLPDAETAQNALRLIHGYRLLGKPLVVEFGRERQEEEKQKKEEQQQEKK
ncbi:RNA-binding protein 41 [Hippoglossus stenolepis]|uniref:RNA-binding protein 41 n=1 Tax=Hippoglossus stenolepis TaxID=195615 RepID=UPI001FAF2F11|nr:RNA-binding protein 41 [Hippoglossus stenolepis]XP_035033728.2 RNA-binding protein 41 [Hippoglossus stenolepis]XP_035033729.2 RNA-binding protein 41 [Hippoglossus stenolepis]XP_035033730.2 RNA-binding protein 41 [Hippoglossus stenolepis]